MIRRGFDATMAAVRRVPRAGWNCALVGFLTALVWVIVIPPFHVPDEAVHVAYAQRLAETGKPPSHEPGKEFSSELETDISALDFYAVVGNKHDKPPWSRLQQEELEERVEGKARDDGGDKSVASNNPPAYYVVNAVAYRLVPGGSTLTRLYAMRFVSAVMAAFTVLFTFLFLRELLPASRWAWSVGALAVAFQPMFGFEAGGVTNDNLLYLCCAALMFALARAWRRGLTPRAGAAIGLAFGVGAATKYTIGAFAPAAALTVLWLLWRAAPEDRRAAFKGAAIAAALALAPVVLYALLCVTVWDRPVLQDAAGTAVPSGPGARPAVLREQFSYIWQLFLPRLPFMTDTFPAATPLWDTWFTGFNGRFGWLDYDFGPTFYRWIWWLVYLPLLALAGAGLWRWRDAVLRRLPELAAYALIVVGTIVVIGRPSYTTWLQNASFPFYQPRYILVLLPLFAALVALAVRGAGRRAGPVVGAIIVMLAMTHTLLAQLLTITRYYT